MKFKIGDTVTIKQLTIKDIYHPLYMPDDMTKYQEQTGQITLTDLVTYEDYSKEPEYCVRFQDGQYWWWLQNEIDPILDAIDINTEKIWPRYAAFVYKM